MRRGRGAGEQTDRKREACRPPERKLTSKGKFYDHNGEVDLKDRVLISWNNFEDYDSLQKIRITEDCIK